MNDVHGSINPTRMENINPAFVDQLNYLHATTYNWDPPGWRKSKRFSESSDPVERRRCRTVLYIAGVLAKVRSGKPNPCFCGWCNGGGLTLLDIEQATEVAQHVTMGDFPASEDPA